MENRTQENQNQTTIQEIREQLAVILLRVTVVVGLLAAIMGTLDSLQASSDVIWPIGLYWGSYSIILILNFWRKAPYFLKALSIILLLFVIGSTDFLDEGLNGSSQVILVSASILTGILLGRRAGTIAITGTVMIMLGFAAAYTSGYLVDPNDVRSSLIGDWLAGTGVVLLLGVLVITALNQLIPQLSVLLELSQSLSNELRLNQANLEDQIQERTSELARRNRQMELTSRVTREFSIIQDMDQLLDETVHLISENFGFYHTGIFLLDNLKTYAVLKAASSEGGQNMLTRGHQLKVGEVGMVGYVTNLGIPRIALDVGKDAVFFDNPDLPETRSEITLPLTVRGEIIGALDVQSKEPDAFDEEDSTILQSLADQVALAINNTRLLSDLQVTLETTQLAYGEISQQAWQKYLGGKETISERFNPYGILTKDREWSSEMSLASSSGHSVLSENSQFPNLAVPIKERGQTIGVLSAYKPENEGEWTQDEISLLEAITEQIGLALESARSFQESQERAMRERITSETTARVRESMDIETIIKTATEEIRTALNLPEVTIRLGQPLSDQRSRS